MSLRRYSEYKPSRAWLLGDLPERWDCRPFKRVAGRFESGTSVNSVDEPADGDAWGVLKTSCVYENRFVSDENKRILPEEYDRATCPVRAGALVVSRMNTPDLVGAAGLVEVSNPRLFLPDRLWQISLTGVEPRFAYWWTQSATYRAQVEAACTGTSASMKNLSQEQFGGFVLPLPDEAEQRTIAAFLDRETAKIDALVAEQERLIELLKEKRQAVISHAVTKGLNQGAPMKPSGIKWVGDVPEHWQVMRVKHVADSVQMGPFGGMLLDLESENTGYKVLGQENTTSGDLTLGQRWVSAGRYAELSHYQVQLGDLLLTRKGSIGNALLVAQLPQPAVIDSDTIRVRVSERVLARRLLALLLHEAYYVAQQIQMNKRGAILAGLNTETIENLVLVVPQATEQGPLVHFLDRETARFDELTAEAQRAIDLLRERRTAVISAAVTGQIDVRGLADPEAA